MSATSIYKEHSSEQKYLEELNFKVFDSKIASRVDPAATLSTMTIEDFLDRKRSNRARLIYCTQEQVKQFEKLADDMKYEVSIDLDDF